MRLTPFAINRIAHGLAINGQAVIDGTIDGVPLLQCLIQCGWTHSNQYIPDNTLTGDEILPPLPIVPTPKTCASTGGSAPDSSRLSPCSRAFRTEDSPGGNPQHNLYAVPLSLCSAGVFDGLEKIG